MEMEKGQRKRWMDKESGIGKRSIKKNTLLKRYE
jgi:hypothetical protein